MNIHKYFIVWAILKSANIFGQQPSPIGILYNPRVNTFAISGVGGGNLYELSAEKSSASGQVAVDFNVAIKNGYTKRNSKPALTTLTTLFKYNPLLKANYVSGDSIELRKIAFIDNEFQMLVGLRFAKISELGTDNNARFVRTYFLDASMTPYQLQKSNWSLNTGFRSFCFNGGLQIGYITNTDFGIVGFTVSPQINFISIYEDHSKGHSFEELNKTSQNLSNNILGGGLRINVPLNDFCFFFEARKYYPLDNSLTIPGLTDRTIFSFGGIATGTVFKTKTKEVKND